MFDTVIGCVHQTNYISAAFTAGPRTMHVLNAVSDSTPAMELVAMRNIISVAHRYVHLAKSPLPLQPGAAWTTLATTIIADKNAILCAPLLNWLRVATTKRFDTDGKTILAPANHLGLLDTALPPVIDDHHFAERRWAVIARNLPALDLSASSANAALATTQYSNILGVLHIERAAYRAADEARCQAEKSNKLPSETKWRYAAARWMKFTGCHNKIHLPPVYLRLANCDNKGDHLLILRKAVADHARNHGAATLQIPVVSKEIKEMVMMGNFGVPTHDHDNLSLGLQPFAVGFYTGDELSKTVEVGGNNYNLMLSGQANHY